LGRALTPRATAGAACLLALAFTALAGIGAPPSYVSERAGAWLVLEPLMLPCLIGGPLVSLAGFFVSFLSPRASGLLCVGSLSASWVGVVVALGLEGGSMWPAMLALCVWAIPGVIAWDAIRNGRKERLHEAAG
jgi:hypothetical protein